MDHCPMLSGSQTNLREKWEMVDHISLHPALGMKQQIAMYFLSQPKQGSWMRLQMADEYYRQKLIANKPIDKNSWFSYKEELLTAI